MESSTDPTRLRSLPSVDRVLHSPAVADLLDQYARPAVVRLVRRVLEDHRSSIATGADAPTLDTVVRQVVRTVEEEWVVGPEPVINATGVVLHTNLGRAPLSREAQEAMLAAVSFVNLELDLESGKRDSRQKRLEPLLLALTGAEAAHVAVNNAAAVVLALATVARGREVIVSRGQAVEIGGGFRVPLILRQSGARLVEVGTTNRTRLSDYAEAISQRTAAILHVHSSNFKIVGFSETVPLSDLAALAHDRGLLLISDNGSGPLLDTADFGLAHEPTPMEALAAGSDVVTFSADKLLGGPQAGIALGRSDLVRGIGRHPLARATRPDKTAIAALSATLLAYLRGDAASTLPIWQMIGQDTSSIRRRAAAWQSRAAECGLQVDLVPGESTVGGGSLPGETLPTVLIVLPRPMTASRLRSAEPPVIARTHEDRVHLDLRTVPPEQDDLLLQAVCRAADRA